MKVGAEIRTGVGLLVAVQILVTFGVMGLLMRMTPALLAWTAYPVDEGSGRSKITSVALRL